MVTMRNGSFWWLAASVRVFCLDELRWWCDEGLVGGLWSGCWALVGWRSASFWFKAMLVLLAGVDRECVCAHRAKCAFSPGVEFAYLISFVQLFYFFLCFSECVPGIVYHPVDFSCCFIGFWSGSFDGDSACALVSFAFFLCVDVDDIFLFKFIDSYSLHFYDDFDSVVGGSDVYFRFCCNYWCAFAGGMCNDKFVGWNLSHSNVFFGCFADVMCDDL